MTTGRFALSWEDRVGVESVAMHHQVAEVLLGLRDHRRLEADPSSVNWRVVDRDGAVVEWCRRCAGAAAVPPANCERCELELEIAKGEPWEVKVRWDWPPLTRPASRRRPFNIAEHLHLL